MNIGFPKEGPLFWLCWLFSAIANSAFVKHCRLLAGGRRHQQVPFDEESDTEGQERGRVDGTACRWTELGTRAGKDCKAGRRPRALDSGLPVSSACSSLASQFHAPVVRIGLINQSISQSIIV